MDDIFYSLSETSNFDVCRPFMFFIIYKKESNSDEIVLFNGKVIDPTME